MTHRIEAIRIRTVLAGLALALLGMVMFIISPVGGGAAEAASTEEKCAKAVKKTEAKHAWLLGPGSSLYNNPGLIADCVALLDAKDALSGGARLNWSANTPITLWKGVDLAEVNSGDASQARVTQLILTGRKLRGRIPNELGELSELKRLTLSDNRLSGKIPKRLSNLSNLTSLNLSNNQMSGNIPKQLSELSNLEYLVLSGNNLTGRIPPQLGNLSKLLFLDLHDNQLTGNIPPRLGKLSSLEDMYLHGNQLSGKIPKQLGRLSKLESLLLRNNQLTGKIPSELGELPKLRLLELYLNRLNGCVPVSLRNIEHFAHTTMYGPIKGIPGWKRKGVKYARLPWCSE